MKTKPETILVCSRATNSTTAKIHAVFATRYSDYASNKVTHQYSRRTRCNLVACEVMPYQRFGDVATIGENRGHICKECRKRSGIE